MLIKRHYYSAALAIHTAGKCKSYRYSKLYAEK